MRDLFIVARHETALYEYLREHFEGRSDVEVILDRRQRDRHRGPPARRPERRVRDRRGRSHAQDDLAALGFAVVTLPW
jgi:hypothetical protein